MLRGICFLKWMITPCLYHEVHVAILLVLQLLLMQIHWDLIDLDWVANEGDPQPLPEEPSELPSQ